MRKLGTTISIAGGLVALMASGPSAATLAHHCRMTQVCPTPPERPRFCKFEERCYFTRHTIIGGVNDFTIPINGKPALPLPRRPKDHNSDAVMDCWKGVTTNAQISSGFPFRNDGTTEHNGMDAISATENYGYGAPIYSLGAGYVFEVGESPANGKFVRVNQGDGTQVTYIHLKVVLVDEEDVISVGELLAQMNCTGWCGPDSDRENITHTHVHIQVRDDLGDGPLLDAVALYGGQNCTVNSDANGGGDDGSGSGPGGGGPGGGGTGDCSGIGCTTEP